VFPLLETTRAQADGLVERLNATAGEEAGSLFRAYLGMKHSPPFIPDGIDAMRTDGVERAVGIVMAPHWSGMSVESYVERVQRAGRTGEPWWGPSVGEVIPQRAGRGLTAVVVCSAGFVADHLETLYDLDIEAKQIAREAGVGFARTRMPNADPAYLDALADVV